MKIRMDFYRWHMIQILSSRNWEIVDWIEWWFCVSCRSTYMDRTIASARSFLAGLFSSENEVQAKGEFFD